MPKSEKPDRLFGIDEILVAAALVLVTVGLWSRVGAVSLTVPGVVLLWMALPPRASFVVRPDPSNRKGTST